FWLANDRLVTVIVVVMVPPGPSVEGVEARLRSRPCRRHVGKLPVSENVEFRQSFLMVALLSVSLVTSLFAATPLTATPKTSDWPTPIAAALQLEPPRL